MRVCYSFTVAVPFLKILYHYLGFAKCASCGDRLWDVAARDITNLIKSEYTYVHDSCGERL